MLLRVTFRALETGQSWVIFIQNKIFHMDQKLFRELLQNLFLCSIIPVMIIFDIQIQFLFLHIYVTWFCCHAIIIELPAPFYLWLM